MEIRKADISDIPNIISLLKMSLGESLMPKTEKYWEWKHVKNPFGTSPVLLACEGERIVGVRAFMKWRWQNKSEIITAIRAVDTATHPEHQGKGIFKKLTLKLLEQCEAEKADLVFNTPNAKSKPGYLKMGWKEAGKFPLQLGVKKPLRLLQNKLFKSLSTEFKELNNDFYNVELAINQFNISKVESTNHVFTDYTKDYLRWRYVDIPMIKYYGLGSDNLLIIFRLKQSGLGVELRIADVLGDKQSVGEVLNEIVKSVDFDYMSISSFSGLSLPLFLKKNGDFGPDVTIRSLYRKEIDDFINFKNWTPSTGDLEVF